MSFIMWPFHGPHYASCVSVRLSRTAS